MSDSSGANRPFTNTIVYQSAVPKVKRSMSVALHVAALRREERELLLGDRRDAREMPVLVLRRRKSEGSKSIERGAPHGLRAGRDHRRGRQFFERRDVRLAGARCHRYRGARHAAAPAGSITQS